MNIIEVTVLFINGHNEEEYATFYSASKTKLEGDNFVVYGYHGFDKDTLEFKEKKLFEISRERVIEISTNRE